MSLPSKSPVTTLSTPPLGTLHVPGNANLEFYATDDGSASQASWSSAAGAGVDDRLECPAWDAECIQHWLRLDETRSALQQHHRDMLELEYDRAELEDWSLSLSSDDLREQWKKSDVTTPGQISLSTLPSIQENNALELEEDSNECLWNDSSYMVDRAGRELVTLLMDAPVEDKPWPYAAGGGLAAGRQVSPDGSWSSGASECCDSHEPETCSKRSSVALSGSSDDTGEMAVIGTDFTRDFYRLVKFESTKSLASTSSRSLGGALSDNGDRDTTLQNVLSFIAEQQKYVHGRETATRPCSVTEITREFNIEGPPPQQIGEVRMGGSDYSIAKSETRLSDNENYVTLKQLCEEFGLKERDKDENKVNIEDTIKQNIAYAEEVCIVTPIDVESENCSNIIERAVDICSSINVELTSIEYQSSVLKDGADTMTAGSDYLVNDLSKSSDTTISDISVNNCTSESMTSSVSTPDTVVSKIPRRKTVSRIPVSPARIIAVNNNNNNNNYNNKDSSAESKIPKSRIPHKSNKPKLKKIVHVQQPPAPRHVITSERLPQSSSGALSDIIEGPPGRAVSFHERATSKDVIDELNRMIRSGDEAVAPPAGQDCGGGGGGQLDRACRPTGWVHVEREIDLTDPKARANLLDVMMASVSSDSSPTSSCGGSVASDSTEDPPDYGQLHRIHKYHRQKKAKAARPAMAVVRAALPAPRPPIIGRPDFFHRYGDKEREAVASFDFLDELGAAGCSMVEEEEEEGCGQIGGVAAVSCLPPAVGVALRE